MSLAFTIVFVKNFGVTEVCTELCTDSIRICIIVSVNFSVKLVVINDFRGFNNLKDVFLFELVTSSFCSDSRPIQFVRKRGQSSSWF